MSSTCATDGRRAVPCTGLSSSAQHRLRRLPRVHRRVPAAGEPLPVRPASQRRDRVPDDHFGEPVPHRVWDAAARRRRWSRHRHQSRREGIPTSPTFPLPASLPPTWGLMYRKQIRKVATMRYWSFVLDLWSRAALVRDDGRLRQFADRLEAFW